MPSPSTTATAWEALVKTALLGTERQTQSVDHEASSSLGQLLSQVSSALPEAMLLNQAAAIGLYRRAGRAAMRGAIKTSEPTDTHDLPPISTQAGEFLHRMLQGEHQALIEEFLTAVAAAGRRVPAQLLPSLLNAGRATASLRPLVLPVLGQRGQWLAQQNETWNYVCGGEPDAQLWETGAPAARLLLLQRLRVSDPKSARVMLEATWKSEAAADRTAFIGALGAQLSQDDEPFLEAALDDKAKEVRKTAAALLASLPESGFSSRMTARALALLVWKEARKPKIEVTLPDSLDAAAQRDGVDSGRRQGVGEKTWWIYQIVSATPPQALCHAWNKTPGQIIEAARDPEWRQLLLEAWTVAAARLHDARWAEALWTQDLKGGIELSPWDAYAKLAPGLPEKHRETLMADRVRNDPNRASDTSDVPLMLRAYERPWGAPLTRAVIELLRNLAADPKSRGQYRLRSALPDFARRVPLDLLPEMADGWPSEPDVWSYWKEPVEQFLAIVQFRHDMLKAIEMERM